MNPSSLAPLPQGARGTGCRASLLSIGDELLLGEIVDTNMPYIAQRLLPLGITVVGTETVGDELDEIAAAFGRALERADIVIATGGLGPTDDDLTFEAVGKALGAPLEFREEVMAQMAARLKRPVISLGGSNRKQATVPRGAEILRNDWGTAPGVRVAVSGLEFMVSGSTTAQPPETRNQKQETRNKKHVFLMPGVPREMKGLLEERIIPWLKTNFRSEQAVVIKTLHAFGIPESVLGERIKPLMQAGQNPNVGTRVAGGVVSVRLVATAPHPPGPLSSEERGRLGEQQARSLLASAAEQVRAALADGLFGEDEETLASATLKALIARKKTVALAESCTAGLVAALLTEVPGSSAALLEGAVVYSNEAKARTCGVKPETLAAHGAVSAQTAQELALGIKARSGASIGLSVTGIAGPDGGTPAKPVGLVWFGIATENGVKTLERNYPGLDRKMVRERAAMQALDLIRRAAICDA